MHCVWHGRRLAFGADWIAELPEATSSVLRQGSSSEYLQALAELALHPEWTLRISSKFEPLLLEFCNRWVRSDDATGKTDFDAFCALSRLLAIHPQLGPYVSEIAFRRRRGVFLHLGPEGAAAYLTKLPEDILARLLIGIYRCLRHNRHTFSALFNGPQITALFDHEQAYIRYLAVKVWSSYLNAADAAFQATVAEHVPLGPANGVWDHIEIDFRYLDLWEKRLHGLYLEYAQSSTTQATCNGGGRHLQPSDLLPSTIVVGSTLQPSVASNTDTTSRLIQTSTTQRNLFKLGSLLVKDKPVLLTGLPGSGKSSLVQDASRTFGKDQAMLTLHLNEQTDAKLLIGMYTSAGTPGSFKWQPGVLTTAVREGRWALIEDLDRAPAEVMSTLLPLMERRQLYVPNLGGSITAHADFRLFATIRSSSSASRSRETAPVPQFLGARHWERMHVEPLELEDLEGIITQRYPLLHLWSRRLLQTYQTLLDTSSTARLAERQTGVSRSLGPRDLFKCCQRISQLLEDAGARKGSDPGSELLQDHVFLEVVDCFAGFAQSATLREHVTNTAAQIWQISPQRREHCLRSRAPTRETSESKLRIGRVKLPRRKVQGGDRQQLGSSQPFAYTDDVLRKMEVLAATVRSREPCLLVGETGTGKTTAVQELAKAVGQKLTVVNLSQQSEAGDLLGGFKPSTMRSLSAPMKDQFDDLFQATVPVDENKKFGQAVDRAFKRGEYEKLVKLWRRAVDMVKSSLPAPKLTADDNPAKRRKTNTSEKQRLRAGWDAFSQSLKVLEMHVKSGGKGFAFHFVEGNIVKAVRNGEWVLLDEINLASPDTLESLADLLTNDSTEQPSLLLTETGDVERVQAHPDFRIFAAMNPATDVGKRDLPVSLRTRFTEFYVTSPDRDPNSLCQIVEACLGNHTQNASREAKSITNLYLEIVKLEDENKLVDGANQRPHYSLRTLTRTLAYVLEIAPLYGLTRSLFEGFSMSFLTLLNRESSGLVSALIEKHILPSKRDRKSILSQAPNPPKDSKSYVRFEHYWLRQGDLEVGSNPRYIITPFIRANLLNLVRAASSRRFPVLLQGPTSSGKTSMVEYLAKISGNSFVRINNHEHTDLQEYLGTYVTDSEGNLSFQEGVLVQALRKGHWIVLDELNLAPTDILEALNRLLDDNRELFIPETQEIIRPHENFMLFATQNPAGLYGGRKALSRAFRNRFLELHFDDIPENELETILTQRTQIAPSHAGIIIKIYRKLAELRQSSRMFEQKGSFATLRDLFRWALRNITTKEELANHGYMLLAERVRNEDEREAVRKAILDVTKIRVDSHSLYALSNVPTAAVSGAGFAKNIVWTSSMCRIYVLVTEALKRNEPVLLVGGTGCGKTSVCQVIAEMAGTQLNIVNAHQNTETGDLIGAQRPIRNRAAIEAELRANMLALLYGADQKAHEHETTDTLQANIEQLNAETMQPSHQRLLAAVREGASKRNALFEWSDGSLVQAMKNGSHFLLDEISLAEDSVLERLNSVLESGRTILLAEKGPVDSSITAADDFQFLATMNPGGDFGKRELSPALRNRFTEIWVPPMSSQSEIAQIATAKLDERYKSCASPMVAFAFWFGERFHPGGPSLSIRDILAWVEFMNNCPFLATPQAIVEGAAMVYIDALGANPAASLSLAASAISEAKTESLNQLSEVFQGRHEMADLYLAGREIKVDEEQLQVGQFSLQRKASARSNDNFSFRAPTTIVNLARLVRALQLKKPLLLEGSPGVGKTTLVAALADVVGIPLTRINLSEQTDLMDIFGSDVPVEGGEAGQFAWRDAPFLQAMKRGEWVLLDEMNLASQSVLEGLNACLDHRGEVFIPELDQTFKRHPEFTIFAAQNPHSQGGGRKGLPASFVNRFTVVYADSFTREDLLAICQERFLKTIAMPIIEQAVDYVLDLGQLTQSSAVLSASGGPWEFNLRDILRWLGLISDKHSPTSYSQPAYFERMLFLQRFRTEEVATVVKKRIRVLDRGPDAARSIYRNLSATGYQAGLGYLDRNRTVAFSQLIDEPQDLPVLESVMIGVMQQWPVLLVGQSGSGKTSLLRHLSRMTGNELLELPLSADMDTMDIVGGYEQADPHRLLTSLQLSFREALRAALIEGNLPQGLQRWSLLEEDTPEQSPFSEIEAMLKELRERTSAYDQVWDSLWEQCSEVRKRLSQDMRARFEWSDGLLIQALETGKWLVLDNANLCSSSVLDRLNSLMEPDGFLAINEHRMPDGSARVIRPHQNFRLFLTMDPRHGELSRAMRNRCLELFMPYSSTQTSPHQGLDVFDSSLFRLRPLVNQAWSRVDAELADPLLAVSLDAVAFRDRDLLESLPAQLANGLFSASQEALQSFPQSIHLDVAGLKKQTVFRESISDMYRRAFRILRPNEQFLADNESIYPMNNSMLLSMAHESQKPSYPRQYPAVFSDLWSSTRRLRLQLERQNRDLCNGTVKAFTKLDRSIMANKVLAFKKDATLPLAGVLHQSFNSLEKFLAEESGSGLEAVDLDLLKKIATYLQDLFDTARTTDLDDAKFQTYLSIGAQLVQQKDISKSIQPVLGDLASQLASFKSQWQLETGLGMEQFWVGLRPQTANKASQREVLYQLETSLAELSKILIGTALPYSSLASMKRRIVNVYHQLCTDNIDADTAREVLSSINEFLASLPPGNDKHAQHFQQSFQGLIQLIELQSDSSVVSETLELATCRPFQSSLHSNVAPSFVKQLHSIQRATGILWDEKPLQAYKQTVMPVLASQLCEMDQVPMGALAGLQNELQELPLAVVEICKTSIQDPRESLSRRLLGLHAEFHHIFAVFMETQFAGQYEAQLQVLQERHLPSQYINKTSSTPKNVPINGSKRMNSVFENHLSGSLNNLGSSHVRATSKAWISFFVGCLLLYIPDRPFDPALESIIGVARHRKRVTEIQTTGKALGIYEEICGYSQPTPRIQAIQEQLAALGDEPQSTSVYRPVKSRLNELSGEFTNVLKSIVKRCETIELGSTDTVQVLSGVAKNIEQVIDRLHANYRDYDDIVQPAIQLLTGLRLGVDLAIMSTAHDAAPLHVARSVRACMPTIGMGRKHLLSIGTKDLQGKGSNKVSEQMLYLQAVGVDSRVLGTIESRYLRVCQQIFDDLYNSWRKNLAKEQDERALKSSLYRYQGGDLEDQDDELTAREVKRLFPSYDDNESLDRDQSITSPRDPGALAKQLAGLHRALFNASSSKQHMFDQLVRGSIKDLAQSFTSKDLSGMCSASAQDLLPSVIELLQRKTTQLSLDNQSEARDFYRDSNIVEVKKVLELAKRVRSRFDFIHEAWPEQASPMDVIRVIEELTSLAHTDPIAKILTKAEQLHTFVYQWEQVASREFNAAGLYTELTDLLVSWRRLELSSWASLLDVEKKTCEEDTKAWWFIAYETIIAASLSTISSQEDFSQHVLALIEHFAHFMKITPIGQFKERLNMIQSFELHVKALSSQQPKLLELDLALLNFLVYHRRFQPLMDDKLRTDRMELDKKMKEIILLSSWKDTNIEALRASSRASHTRLFKIVRKYRALLAESAEPLLAQEPPFSQDLGPANTGDLSAAFLPNVEKLRKLKEAVPTSINLPERFQKPSNTLATMARICQLPAGSINVATHLHSWLQELISDSTELQKETPKILTEDNKAEVQHLKVRKRKVFAGVLKDLRVMGLKTNIDTQTLEAQESTAKILTRAGSSVHLNSDDEFFRVIDNLDKIRLLSRDPAGDLASTEVARSTVYLQGLVDLVIQQRSSLSTKANDLDKAETTNKQLRVLSDCYLTGTLRTESTISSNNEVDTATARWLPMISRFSARLLKLHDQMGGESTQSIQDSLESYALTAEQICRELDTAPEMPSRLTTTDSLASQAKMSETLGSLKISLDSWDNECQRSSFATRLIRNWLPLDPSAEQPNRLADNTPHSVDYTTLKILDRILKALENTSKIVGQHPISTADNGWLFKSTKVLQDAMAALSMSEISSLLHDQLNIIGSAGTERLVAESAALCSFVSPFFETYHSICQSLFATCLSAHISTTKTARVLSDSFRGLLSNGFCSPKEESKGDKAGQEKLEEGTGLGDGEGAEDISKDIQDDEDLSELAQGKKEDGEENDIEGEDNAVDMADQDMEGKMDEDGEQQDADDNENGEDNDEDGPEEELGDVGNDDPEAIDEKLWDSDKKDEESENQNKGDQQSGKKDDQMAANEDDNKQPEGDTADDLSNAEEDAEAGQEINDDNMPSVDPHLQEEEKLDLPDDIDMDADQKSMADESDLEEMEDAADATEQDKKDGADTDAEVDDDAAQEQDDPEKEDLGEQQDGQDADIDAESDGGGEEAQENPLRDQDDAVQDAEDQVQGDTDGLAGSGETEEQAPEQEQTQTGGTQGQSGAKDEAQGTEESADSEQQAGSGTAAEGMSAEDSLQDSAEAQAFKKLGDALERFQRTSKEIRQAQNAEDKPQPQDKSDREATDFEHLPDENAESDEQALGNADEEQVRGLEDGAMDLDQPMKEADYTDQALMNDEDDDENQDPSSKDDADAMEVDNPNSTTVGQRQSHKKADPGPSEDISDGAKAEEDIQELDDGLSEVHLQPPVPSLPERSAEDALKLWQECELQTNDLAMSLTEQLRLVLAPTLATKMRGDFRTGKRLNIKRIIPYIASQYKRDKIWMRRSIPSRRNYQIMIAVDDSKSMNEHGGGSSQLAFETLALVSRSLSMLEAGQLCVLGFGKDVHVAHSFDQTFSSSAGANILQHFLFEQNTTDVRHLVSESLRLFREARAQNQNTDSELWQIELIISDGICEDHEGIRQLVRQAHQERVMMVFVIVDALKGTSITTLDQASFVTNATNGKTELKMDRYLAKFPFDYYLIVGDVRELPAVLATALRQWFSEIADT